MWSTTTRTRVIDATAVTFSVKWFNPLKDIWQQTTSGFRNRKSYFGGKADVQIAEEQVY